MKRRIFLITFFILFFGSLLNAHVVEAKCNEYCAKNFIPAWCLGKKKCQGWTDPNCTGKSWKCCDTKSECSANPPATCGELNEPCCSSGQQCKDTSWVCDVISHTCKKQGSSDDTYDNPLGAGGCPVNQIYTAIGCIPITSSGFTAFILRWAIGIGGGLAFLLIIYAGFIIMTSSGNPERLKAGQELLTSAIMGLVLLIFSVFILRIIGVEILKIPGF